VVHIRVLRDVIIICHFRTGVAETGVTANCHRRIVIYLYTEGTCIQLNNGTYRNNKFHSRTITIFSSKT